MSLSSLVPSKELFMECIDNKDCISLNIFWEIIDNNKIIVYPEENYNDVKFYYDSNCMLRCFEITSLRYLKTYQLFTHPITKDIIPIELFVDLELIQDDEVPLYKFASDVFALFNNYYLEINYNLFMSLSLQKLLQLYSEMTSFWRHNLNNNERNNISREIFNKHNYDLNNLSFEDIQKYILQQMKILLEYNGPHAYLIINILIGALQIVIPEINTDYVITDYNIIE